MLPAFLMLSCAPPNYQNKPTQTPIIVVVPGENSSEPTLQTSVIGIEGFPTPITCEAGTIEQPFEHGRMFWVGKSIEERCSIEHAFAPHTGEIWVAIFDNQQHGGMWLSFIDTWDTENNVPFDLTMTEPAGLLQPVRGFGKVWRDELTSEQRANLGWATGPELAYTAAYRYDAGGTIDDTNQYVPRRGQHVLTSLIGERFFFDEETGLFDYIPASDE